jgi:hypothetical protein
MRSLTLDIRLHGGPRVKLATGFAVRRTVRACEEMLRLLWSGSTNHKIIHDLVNGHRLLADVYVAYLSGKLADLGAANSPENEAVEPTMDAWLTEFQVSASHQHRCRQALKELLKQAKYRAKLTDLPELLDTYRTHCVKVNTPRSFNYAKQAARAFLRDTVGRRHPLYAAVADVAGMTEAKQGVSPLTVEQARAVRDRLRQLPERLREGARARSNPPRWTATCDEAARTWWGMCTTGMGSTEFWGEWTALNDRVRIKGTKRPGRRWGSQGREVPLVATLVAPAMSAGRFAKLLRKAGASPYQARHSYATWLEDSEIPRTRRMLYLGHAGKDITDRYERREITQFLAADRARLMKLLGPDTRLEMSKTAGLMAMPIAQEA